MDYKHTRCSLMDSPILETTGNDSCWGCCGVSQLWLLCLMFHSGGVIVTYPVVPYCFSIYLLHTKTSLVKQQKSLWCLFCLKGIHSVEGMISPFVMTCKTVASLIVGLWLEGIIKLDWMLSICPTCLLIEPWNLNRLACRDCFGVGKSGVQSSHQHQSW